MKKYILLITSALVLMNCQNAKPLIDAQAQISRLERQLATERQDGIELNGIKNGIQSQYNKRSDDYVKCNENNTMTMETLTKNYDALLADFTKLQIAYKTLSEAHEVQQQNASLAIQSLEERIRTYKIPTRGRVRRAN
jgi:hypothetical protein